MLICESSEKSPVQHKRLGYSKRKNFSPVNSDQHTENQLTVEV